MRAGGIVPLYHIVTGGVGITLPHERETDVGINGPGDNRRLCKEYVHCGYGY